jgi:hypothetical protein
MKEGIFVIIFIVLLIAGAATISFGLYSFFGPKYAEVDRQIFENSQAYNEGMLRDLQNLRLQYLGSKDDETRAALKATILHRFSVYPRDKLPLELSQFYNELTSKGFQ